MRKFIFICILIFNFIFSNIPVTASEDAKDYILESSLNYTAGSVLVMDARTGVVLYETEGYTRRYPASITKIMTALVVLEQVEDLSERLVFSENAVNLPHYAGRMNMEAGESITVLEALYGIMLPSANDIARALAEHVSGNMADFVTLMNLRAEELGAYNTRFINPCGLPGDGQFTTAYDIALIKKAAVQNPLYVEIIGTPYFDLPPTNIHAETRQMTNSNVMVRPSRAEFNTYVIGGKTGFTNAAQHTLVTYAKNDRREIIVSVLFASPRGVIFTDTATLIDYIFNELPEPEPPKKMPEDLEIVRVFAYNKIIEISPPPEKQNIPAITAPKEISDIEAMATASMSVALLGVALIALALIRKKYYN